MIHINRRMVEATGEPHQLLSAEMLESACAKPKNAWHYGETDAVNLACALGFGIARNHPFIQGNKRTGFTAMMGFLGVNGFKLLLIDSEAAADAVLKVLSGEFPEEAFAAALHNFVARGRPWA